MVPPVPVCIGIQFITLENDEYLMVGKLAREVGPTRNGWWDLLALLVAITPDWSVGDLKVEGLQQERWSVPMWVAPAPQKHHHHDRELKRENLRKGDTRQLCINKFDLRRRNRTSSGLGWEIDCFGKKKGEWGRLCALSAGRIVVKIGS